MMTKQHRLVSGLVAAVLFAGCGAGDAITRAGSGSGTETGVLAPAPALESTAGLAPGTGDGRDALRLVGAGMPESAGELAQPYPIEEFYQDYFGALDLVNNWWAGHWSEYFTGAYTPPRLIDGGVYGLGLYSRDSGTPDDEFREDELQFTCAGQPLDPNNALHCSGAEDFVAFDIEFLLRARTLGDVFVYMIVAHEWGHAIAADLQTSLVPDWYELQADCFAGATLQGARNDGTLLWEAGDDQEVVNGLNDIGALADWGEYYFDYNAGEWRQATHGSPQQRIDAYNHGVQNGVNACLNFQ
jgi:uncharacterized protein